MNDFNLNRTETTKDEWLTPPEIIRALGSFDLDPCAPVARPWPMARRHFTELGLIQPWAGRVWLNPPYGNETALWMERLAGHGNGIALIFARTETRIFFPWVWERADAIFFFEGRLSFHHVNGEIGGNAGAPSVLVAYGSNNVDAIELALGAAPIVGKLLKLK